MMNSLFNMHHKIKLKLDAICQEAGDMNVEEFMQVYKQLQKEIKTEKAMYTPSGIKLKSKMEGETYGTAITNRFREDMIDDMDMGQ
tara:strand:+ start:282 stop:539 length:258 start_codon:yes stop_codon:yes gene_type:complete